MDDIARTLEPKYLNLYGSIGKAQSHMVVTIKKGLEALHKDKKLNWLFCPTHYRGNEWTFKNNKKKLDTQTEAKVCNY